VRPGPKPQPSVRLSAAAIEYALALEESKGHPKREWDRLVKAALRYRAESKSGAADGQGEG
jgi:hypothetical protein